jgi:hypothetical protein
MGTKLRLVTRIVVFLTLALTSLGAAPIYHAHYQGQATLISSTVTCSMSVTRDDAGELIDHFETQECTSGTGLGAYIYGEAPSFSLPAGSVVLSAEMRQWGQFNIDAFDSTYSVEPIDPAKPFSGEAFRGSPPLFIRVEAYDWPFQSNWVPYTFERSFDLLDADYAKGYLSWAREVSVSLSSGATGADYPGMNSVTTQTVSYRLVNGTAFYSLDFTYEAPIPEPATASLFLAGATGLFLLRRTFRTGLLSRR